MKTVCPGCSHEWTMSGQMSGMRVRCPDDNCKHVFIAQPGQAVSASGPEETRSPSAPEIREDVPFERVTPRDVQGPSAAGSTGPRKTSAPPEDDEEDDTITARVRRRAQIKSEIRREEREEQNQAIIERMTIAEQYRQDAESRREQRRQDNERRKEERKAQTAQERDEKRTAKAKAMEEQANKRSAFGDTRVDRAFSAGTRVLRNFGMGGLANQLSELKEMADSVMALGNALDAIFGGEKGGKRDTDEAREKEVRAPAEEERLAIGYKMPMGYKRKDPEALGYTRNEELARPINWESYRSEEGKTSNKDAWEQPEKTPAQIRRERERARTATSPASRPTGETYRATPFRPPSAPKGAAPSKRSSSPSTKADPTAPPAAAGEARKEREESSTRSTTTITPPQSEPQAGKRASSRATVTPTPSTRQERTSPPGPKVERLIPKRIIVEDPRGRDEDQLRWRGSQEASKEISRLVSGNVRVQPEDRFGADKPKYRRGFPEAKRARGARHAASRIGEREEREAAAVKMPGPTSAVSASATVAPVSQAGGLAGMEPDIQRNEERMVHLLEKIDTNIEKMSESEGKDHKDRWEPKGDPGREGRKENDEATAKAIEYAGKKGEKNEDFMLALKLLTEVLA